MVAPARRGVERRWRAEGMTGGTPLSVRGKEEKCGGFASHGIRTHDRSMRGVGSSHWAISRLVINTRSVGICVGSVARNSFLTELTEQGHGGESFVDGDHSRAAPPCVRVQGSSVS